MCVWSAVLWLFRDLFSLSWIFLIYFYSVGGVVVVTDLNYFLFFRLAAVPQLKFTFFFFFLFVLGLPLWIWFFTE